MDIFAWKTCALMKGDDSMSHWTHCDGAMCIIGTEEQLEDVNRLIGKELRWDSSNKEWKRAIEHPEEYMPYGSEGSIRLRKMRKRKPVYSLYSNEQRYKKYYVLEGALRDWTDEAGLMHWFSELIFSIERINGVVVEARFSVYGAVTLKQSYKTEQEIYVDDKNLSGKYLSA